MPTTPSTDRIELMQTFVRIVEAGSLSAAASQLGTTQPTVSRRLQQLERSLGLRLLQRSTHAMSLTEDGARCYQHAKELVANWEALDADLRSAGDEPQGTLRVIAPHAFGQQHLVGPLTTYLRRYPRVTVEWLLHDRTPDFIADNVDCAIHVGDVSDPLLVAIRLAEVPRIVVAAPQVLARGAAPVHPSALSALPWLELRTYYRNQIELTHASTGTAHRLAFRPLLSTDSLYALRTAVIQGLGVGVISSWIVADDIAHGRLIHLTPQWRAAPLPMTLIYPYASHYPAKLRRFVEIVREAVPAVMQDGDPDAQLGPR
jgi:DNA-binding transcriptional LysR family regulator